MITRNRAILLSLAAVVALAVSASASLAQEPGPSYSPDGAWFATAYMSGGTTLPFMDIYTSNPTTQGRSGTVLCTLSVPAFVTPYGKLNMLPGGHGNWIRTDKNTFAFTVWRILIDADPTNLVPDGAPMGTAKFWGTITATGPDTFVGTMKAEYYGPTGTSFLTMPAFTTAGTRIAIQIEDPE